MGIFSKIKKSLKKTTKILDPVGHQIRKSTGGSYMDPLNQYNSKPNTAPPYQARTSPGLIPAPSGPAPQGIKFGANTGGYNYLPNRFSGGVQQSAPSGVGPTMQPGMMKSGINPVGPPAGPIKGGAMSFGGAPPQMMSSSMPPPSIPQPQAPQQPSMQNQLQQAMALRGRRIM